MTAACMHKHAGLVTGHAYTIVGVVELKGGPKLVKLRNPWGKEMYKGAWRDDDPKWTDDFKKQAKLVKADDGIFHMPAEDFRKAFTVYDICMYDDGWKTS